MSLPAPYYQDSAVTLYHGDCREIVPALGRFDLLLTDPPYGINGAKQLGRDKGGYSGDWTDDALNLRNHVVPLIVASMSFCTAVVLTPGNTNFSLYPQPDSFGCFYQPAAVGVQTFGNSDSQPIFYYGKNPTKAHFGKPLSFVMVDKPEDLGHPCSKPLLSWSKLLRSISLEGQTVLDPFAGSGTTGRACKDIGRKCVMIEREEKYCEIAARRMGQEVLQF